MALSAVLAVFAVGLAAGLLSGLVGIGGGVLMVPFLYFFYAHPAFSGIRPPPDVATVAAHATSLAVILPTSVRGALAFHRAGLVEWRAVWPIGIAAAIAAVLATRLATVLPPETLRLAFGALLFFSGARLLGSRKQDDAGDAERPLRLSFPVTAGTGTVIGGFSALMGVGGGVIGIPLLIQIVGIRLKRVAATSIGIVTLTSMAGAAAYMAVGPAAPVRPGLSVGYVDLAPALALAAGALLAVRWGTTLNRRMNPRALAAVFGALFLAQGIYLVVENLPF